MRPDIASLEFSYGKIDIAIGRVVFPVVRRAARSFGNFTLARLLTFTGLMAVAGTSILANHQPWPLFVAALYLWSTVVIVKQYIRPMERYAAQITDSVPAGVYRVVRYCSSNRVFYVGASVCTAVIYGTGDHAGLIVGYGTFAIANVFSLYATTCIVSKMPSKIAAKARAMRQATSWKFAGVGA